MIPQDDLAFLAAMLAGGEEDPRAEPIPPRRLALLARNPAAMTRPEMAALLLSPRTRAAFDAARAAPPAVANDNDYELRFIGFAADDGSEGPIELQAPFGRLTVRPGPDEEMPYMLSFRLDASVPGGLANRRVQAWEKASGAMWLDGTTDAAGELGLPWTLGGASPRERLRQETITFAIVEAAVP